MTLSDPVGAGEIAKRAGVVKATVWSWQKRHSDFPAPWRQLEMGPLWDWAEVEAWLRARTVRTKDGILISAAPKQEA
jgi:predicted DNA-binding transcriptional regulator AlpA